MSEEIRQIPEEFKKVVPDFINDIKTTFPEYVPIINQWWVSNTFDEPEMTAKIEKVFNHCLGIFPERFFDILYKNAEIFNKDSDVNTEFLPGLSFKYLWNFDISDNTKETIWKYLQLISISIIGCVKDQSAFGDSAKLFESLNEDDFKSKLEETLEKMQNMFENNSSGGEGNESTSDDKVTYTLKPSDFTKNSDKIGMIALGRASSMLKQYRAANGLTKIEIPSEKANKVDTLYNFLQNI
jgi:hypothetical protein